MKKLSELSLHAQNEYMLELFSMYLNFTPDYVDEELIKSVTNGEKSMNEYAYAGIMAAVCGLDVYENADDNKFFKNYFVPAVKFLDLNEYKNDPYYSNIDFPIKKCGKWELSYSSYKPFEAFVYDDMCENENGRLLVKIGFFDGEFKFPVVKENGREWMSVTPNEINTMKDAIAKSEGNVLTFGLGLGYFAYMAASKKEVKQVTVVERDKEIIELFKNELLPLMDCRDKINIVNCDAFEFIEKFENAEKEGKTDAYDVVFADIWHDAADGTELYLKMKKYEKKFSCKHFLYWIEPTLKIYSGT